MNCNSKSILEEIETLETLCYTQQEDKAKTLVLPFAEKLVQYTDSFCRDAENLSAVSEIEKVLNGILQAFENNDYVLIADLLEFRLKAILM